MIHIPPRRILVPLDSDARSMEAWHQAAYLTNLIGARAEALYVRSWQPVTGEQSFAEAAFESQAHEEALRWLRARLPSGTPLHALDGFPAARIVEFARNDRFDLIVMGTHGRHGLPRAALGSVAEDVARHSAVPVLVVPRARESFRSLLAPVNLAPYSLPGLRAAAAMAEGLEARLSLLSVVTPPTLPDARGLEAMQRLQRDALDSLPATWRRHSKAGGRVAFGDPLEEILRESERHDMIVLVSHLKRPIRDRLFGTTAERVIRRSLVPVLVIPMKPAAPMPSAGVYAEEVSD